MAKTVSSAGLADFISTGKPTQVFENDQTSRRQAEAAKAKLDAKLAVVDSGTQKPPETPPAQAGAKAEEGAKSADNALPAATEGKTEPHEEADDLKGIPLSEAAQKRLDKWLAKRTAMTKTAQEEAKAARNEAAESERFSETLFNEREEWRKRAEAAEQRAGAAQPKPAEPPKKPEPKDFTDDKGQFKAIEYAEALASWSATQALEKRDREAAEDRKKEETERFNAEVRSRIEAATQKYPDWQKKVTGSEVTLQNECLAFIARSPQGMDLAYYLADNIEEAKRIRALDPYLAVAELGVMAGRFKKTAEPPASSAAAPKAETPAAPAPITPISTSGAGSVVIDPAKMSFKQLREWHRERRKAGVER